MAIKSSGEALGFLDFLGVVGFLIDYLNYVENVGQSDMQETVNQAIKIIQKHLQEQDKKIDIILNTIKGMDGNNG